MERHLVWGDGLAVSSESWVPRNFRILPSMPISREVRYLWRHIGFEGDSCVMNDCSNRHSPGKVARTVSSSDLPTAQRNLESRLADIQGDLDVFDRTSEEARVSLHAKHRLQMTEMQKQAVHSGGGSLILATRQQQSKERDLLEKELELSKKRLSDEVASLKRAISYCRTWKPGSTPMQIQRCGVCSQVLGFYGYFETAPEEDLVHWMKSQRDRPLATNPLRQRWAPSPSQTAANKTTRASGLNRQPPPPPPQDKETTKDREDSERTSQSSSKGTNHSSAAVSGEELPARNCPTRPNHVPRSVEREVENAFQQKMQEMLQARMKGRERTMKVPPPPDAGKKKIHSQQHQHHHGMNHPQRQLQTQIPGSVLEQLTGVFPWIIVKDLHPKHLEICLAFAKKANLHKNDVNVTDENDVKQLARKEECQFVREQVSTRLHLPIHRKSDEELLLEVRYFGVNSEALCSRWRNKNDYARLGLPARPTGGEVKKAYRQLAKKWHPDSMRRGRSLFINEDLYRQTITEVFQLIDDAYRRCLR